MRILFVCTGNVCRSPTAERLAIAYAAQLMIHGFTASSAGVRAMIGHPMHHETASVLESLGGDTSNFAARQLTKKIAADADLVLTMTRSHRDIVLEHAPQRLHQTFTLSEAASLISKCDARSVADLAALRSQLTTDENLDIPDPIGHHAEYFLAIGSQIADLLPPILELCRAEPSVPADNGN